MDSTSDPSTVTASGVIQKFLKDAQSNISDYAILGGNSHTDNVKILTNGEIIFDDFKGKESLHLANRGNTFVSLSGFLEILSKTELSSDKIYDFQEDIFGQ